jgi:hypothetical protein
MTPDPTPEPPSPPERRRWQPWRSAAAGYVVAAAALVAGVPLFLCMPPWGDVTLYDLAVRNVLRGGVHYRDVFDTNLPGIVWAMAAIRAAFGWSYEALRAWDLALIAAAVVLLAGWIRKSGGTAASVAWFVAAATLFYPFTSEFCHCQRDPWMLLPAAAAARLRLRQLGRATAAGRGLFGPAVLEGFVWGLAVWLKPHVVVPAAAVWLTSAVLTVRSAGGRKVATDFLGLLCGGLLAAAPGVAWLVGTGAWPDFIDVFTNWNREYAAQTWSELPDRLADAFTFFRPWGVIHFAAVPLAVLSLWHARSGRAGAAAGALLAAFYLGWLAQAVVLQRGFDYVRVPDTFLALAVLAARGWSVGFPFLAWFLAVGGLLNLADAVPSVAPAVRAIDPDLRGMKLEKHPLTEPQLLALWPRCWREGGSPALRDRVGQYVDVHCGTRWTDLEAVAAFLRTIDPPLHDRELNCWHDSTHPLYLMLDLQPATRYVHYGTVLPIRSQADRIRREVAACPQRYVVSDLRRMTYRLADAYAPGADGPNSLPAWFPRSQRETFPWNQPIVFRAGRYLVHKIAHPPRPEEIDIPDWDVLDQLGPGVGVP